jgi:hypothetical protein
MWLGRRQDAGEEALLRMCGAASAGDVRRLRWRALRGVVRFVYCGEVPLGPTVADDAAVLGCVCGGLGCRLGLVGTGWWGGGLNALFLFLSLLLSLSFCPLFHPVRSGGGSAALGE